MNENTGVQRSCQAKRRAYALVAPALLLMAGCTPEEQQALLEQIPSLLGDLLSQLLVAQGQQLVTFIASFARNALGAFLF